MKLNAAFSLLSSLACALAVPAPRTAKHHVKPAYFVLAGDSTTALQNSGGGGWGAGFLNDTLRSPASGKNYGHNGRTTVSFRAGGDWGEVLDEVESHKNSNEVFVTIQFGHNDQKPAANISLAEYSANLAQFVTDVRTAGGQPILVTPLTRRAFSGNPPRIVENLADQRNATIAVAQSLHSRYVDLNLASTNYCNAIGPAASWVYNLNDTANDTTHLNDYGSVVFGRIVSDLMVEKYDDIKFWTKPNATLTYELDHGIPA
ncbi:hypothetical protein LTR08_006649 [Meristemomyces frigidus]|nr:hypothetical protein LTR08_006649 [Meristemomyces frigidus]